MKFHLLGNEALVDFIIRFNLCGTAQSADLQEFCKVWKDYTFTEEYKKAKKDSETKGEGHERRAKKIWKLKQEINRGKWIADWIEEACGNWYRLSPQDKDLYQKFSENVLQSELDELLRTPLGDRYPGAGSTINRMKSYTVRTTVRHRMKSNECKQC